MCVYVWFWSKLNHVYKITEKKHYWAHQLLNKLEVRETKGKELPSFQRLFLWICNTASETGGCGKSRNLFLVVEAGESEGKTRSLVSDEAYSLLPRRCSEYWTLLLQKTGRKGEANSLETSFKGIYQLMRVDLSSSWKAQSPSATTARIKI